ncbi:MAG: RluA family pseudouridine synthase [Flavobacteriales bacterium]|nr:RluA family pseudouridine synthase [Flavobacteriales bacterium]
MSNTEPALVLLYEDAFLCVALKPAGMPVQQDLSGDRSLLEVLQAHYDDSTIGLVHRLDRPVSGVVVFARDAENLAALNGIFRDRQVDKVYWAVVEGAFKEQCTLQHRLMHDQKMKRAKETSAKDPDGADALLDVKPLKVGDRYTLLEVRPAGGAFHQIRAQLALAGHPIKGDVKYGARRGEKDRSIMLHARSLAFQHPMTDAPVLVEAPAPDGTLWKALLG